MNSDYKLATKCNVCNSINLEAVFDVKAMPLTGLYLPSVNLGKSSPSYDQGLYYCVQCGHGQLKNILNPRILYDNTYMHRSSTSAISTSGNDYFHNYIRKIAHKEIYKSVLEVGCNDLYLINKIQDLGTYLIGIDPIWKGKDHFHNPKTQILGRFIEELNFDADIEGKPDLILSAHTFEHVNEIYAQFQMLVDLASDDCLFVIEMPCFDTMVKIGRYDQVFHQHLQHLSLSSMTCLINRLGCKYIDHTFNHNYWGGTLLFSFQKTTSTITSYNPKFDQIGLETARNGFSNFRKQLQLVVQQLTLLNEPCYGFGAAQMLPVLAHHMESDLGFLEAILDDNNERVGKFLPGISSPVVAPSQIINFSDAAIIVTALDSMRPILRRLMDLSPRRLLSPVNIF
jgi:hypothetical protein